MRVGNDVIRLAPPLAIVRGSHASGHWSVAGRDLRTEVVVEGDGNGTDFHVLPVPLPAERRQIDTDFEHLGGRIHLSVKRRGRLLFEGTSLLAGLEIGSVPVAPAPS